MPPPARDSATQKRLPDDLPVMLDGRWRLAQLLHNTVCQELTGICFLAGAAAHKYETADAEAARRFTEIADLVQQAGARLAEIVHDLDVPPVS